jgi:hypothetical protein
MNVDRKSKAIRAGANPAETASVFLERGATIMQIRTSILGACVGMLALGAANLPARAEGGRNAAAAVGAATGLAAGAAIAQGGGYYGGGYYGPRRGYYRHAYEDEGWRRGRWDADEDDWHRHRGWCYRHPGAC